jgi:hypothetical protein
MKTGLKFSLIILTTFLTACDKEKFVDSDRLPREIRNYVEDHFSESTITHAVIDRDDLHKSYEVFLSNNVHLEFNRRKEIIDIDGKAKLPDSVIPASIRNYVSDNFPNNFITDWEVDDRKQKIGLNNEVELLFTESGSFVGRD